MKKLIITALTFVIIQACSNNDTLFVCTEEFRTVGVNISGGELTEFFTLHNENQDTLRHTDTFQNGNSTFYPVLTDAFQEELEGREESFTFKGLIDDQIVVDEVYVIKADQCHIELVSGKTEISL